MIAFLVFAITYLVAMIAGLVLSFLTKSQARRRSICIVTSFLFAPPILILTVFIFLRFTLFREPPDLTELQRDFPSEKIDLETILRMSNEDASFPRIAPTFVDRVADAQGPSGRYMAGDPKQFFRKPGGTPIAIFTIAME